MGTRPIYRPPLLTFSTHGSRFTRLSTLLRAARDAGAAGIDLDLSGRPFQPASQVIAARVGVDGVPVRSVWVSTAGTVDPRCWTSRAASAATTAGLVGASSLVLRLPNRPGTPLSRTALTSATETARALVPAGTSIVVAVGGAHLEGGRSHLAQLTLLRRLAEEWDFGLALDLLGRFDPRWEAEAAVARLGVSLKLIRLPARLLGSTADGRSRIVTRTVASALDAGRPAMFALVPPTGGLHNPWSPGLSRDWAATSQRILARYSALEAERLLEVQPRRRPGFRA